VIDIEMLVDETELIEAVTPVPLNVTPVAPVRFVPVSVALRFPAPCAPNVGLTVNADPPPAAGVTVNPPGRVATTPPGNITVTSTGPSAAAREMLIDITILVVEAELIEAVTPVPLNTTPVAPTRFVPVSVAVNPVVPCFAEAGCMAVNKGAPLTVNPPGKIAVTPPGNVTITSRAPSAAPGAIVITIEMLPGDTEPTDAVTPAPPNVTPVAPVRLVPVTTALKLVAPCAPKFGAIAVTTLAEGCDTSNGMELDTPPPADELFTATW
jgi:hypothetical protein